MTTTNNAVNNVLSGSTGTGSFVGSASPTITGTLTFPTPFTLGATSVTSTGTQLNLLNGLTVVPINKIAIQAFTASGTYTPTAGMVYCIAKGIGGGGAGGGGASSGGQSSGGGGGGSGAYVEVFLTAAQIGVSKAVTIGAGGLAGSAGSNPGGNGGDTSLDVLLVAKGGTGGSGATTNQVSTAGGAGGQASGCTGTVKISGGTGGVGGGFGLSFAFGGLGGEGLFGGGGSCFITNVATTGNAATAVGSGGSGGVSWNGSSVAGGAGLLGFLWIQEFISA